MSAVYLRLIESLLLKRRAYRNATIPNRASGVRPIIDVLESGIYAEDTWRPTNRLRINGGLRLSVFQQKAVGYIRPEPRLSAAYSLRPDLSVKASYALMNQYVHLLSNTGIGLPTDALGAGRLVKVGETSYLLCRIGSDRWEIGEIPVDIDVSEVEVLLPKAVGRD